MRIQKRLLSTSRPDLASQFHPEKNHDLSPEHISDSHTGKIWWICELGHEWQDTPRNRAKNPAPMCPKCNSLACSHPNLAKEWHPSKNGTTTPFDVTSGSHYNAWWKCPLENDHEWQSIIRVRVAGTGCQVCNKRVATPSNCLKTTHPHIAAEWDHMANKNLGITPTTVTEICRTTVNWICQKNPLHKWSADVRSRASTNTKCPYCTNRKVSTENSLAFTHPEIAGQWHPTKNGDLTPEQVTRGSEIKVWWKCPAGKDHEWEAYVYSRTSGRTCPYCLNRKTAPSNCLATTHPIIAEEWDYKKNFPLTPYDVTGGSINKVHWKCNKAPDHEWKAQINSRVIRSINGQGKCPCCQGKKAVLSNCLATIRPDIAEEWDLSSNSNTPYNITPGSSQKVIWKCKNNQEHTWQATVSDRVNGHGCPYCNLGWTVGNIRLFIKSLLPFLNSLPPQDLYVIFQQSGLLDKQYKSKLFVKSLSTGKFPVEELKKFTENQPSLVDEFLSDSTASENSLPDDLQSPRHSIPETHLETDQDDLPSISTKDVLSFLDSSLVSTFDNEAIEYLIKSAVAKIWHQTFLNEVNTLEELQKYSCQGVYSKEVKRLFETDYQAAKNLVIPPGYNFPFQPNLMQSYTAHLVKSRKRVGNWSGTGAGKTLSAVLSSRVIESRLTVVCCPNNVVDIWRDRILEIYPNSTVFTKPSSLSRIPTNENFLYLILNYEYFQKIRAESDIKKLLDRHTVDFVIIDEIHFSKQRRAEKISMRKRVISSFLSEAFHNNRNLHVLGMSATPIVNNLYEGKSLIELITGESHEDLNTKPTISNCISHYQKFVSHGIRWTPRYNYILNHIIEPIDCSHFISDLKQSSRNGTFVDLEAILTKAKIPFILENLRPKTIIYTHYIQGILNQIQDAIEQRGWKVAIFTGDVKDNLTDFTKGSADILLTSSCIGTGVDGLQHVSNRLIINSLPWTHAEFQQLKGRIYRQGQKNTHVDILIPLTFAEIDGKRWSWCESRWKRIQFKKSIADAAVDGVIPEGHLRTPAQAYKDIMSWLERLDQGKVYEAERRKIFIPLSSNEKSNVRKKLGDLSQMNERINRETSEQTHQRFIKDHREWEYYHAEYREKRKSWEIIPYQEVVKWLQARPHLVIGDFGCGEAFLASELENQVHSFDHIAINENVVACDIAHVPLDDESLDAVVFSLSLMGSNYIDYLKEASRCLKLDGHLWIAEPTSRIKDLALFEDLLFRLGFDLVRTEKKWKFTFIKGIKSERVVNYEYLKGCIKNRILG